MELGQRQQSQHGAALLGYSTEENPVKFGCGRKQRRRIRTRGSGSTCPWLCASFARFGACRLPGGSRFARGLFGPARLWVRYLFFFLAAFCGSTQALKRSRHAMWYNTDLERIHVAGQVAGAGRTYLTRSHSGPLRPHFFLLRGFPFGSSDSFSYRFRAHLPECSI